MKRLTVSLATAALLTLYAGASSAQTSLDQPEGPTVGTPAATVDISGGSVGLGIGYTWIHGTLHYKGTDYPFSANGLSLANVGASSIKGTGKVFQLLSVEYFPGIYSGIGAGATVAAGGGGVALRNQNDVVMDLSATAIGLEFAIAAQGVTVAFDGPAVPAAVGSSAPKQ